MPPRRTLILIVLIALAHAALFIVYQRPDWEVAWSDQGGYQQLGAAMARSGEFTRFPESPVFIPEVHSHAWLSRVRRGDLPPVRRTHAAGGDCAGVGLRADLPDRLRDCEARRRRSRRHGCGGDDGALPAAALLRRARAHRSVDHLRDGAGVSRLPAGHAARPVPRFHARRRVVQRHHHRAAGLRAAAVRTGHRDAAAGAVRAEPRPAARSMGGARDRRGRHAGAVVHL